MGAKENEINNVFKIRIIITRFLCSQQIMNHVRDGIFKFLSFKIQLIVIIHDTAISAH